MYQFKQLTLYKTFLNDKCLNITELGKDGNCFLLYLMRISLIKSVVFVWFAPALPKFHTHPVSMSVYEGGVARFQCQINGVPEAKITWERDRVLLSNTDSR